MTRLLTDITGIGPAAADHLKSAGFISVEDVAKATPVTLSAAQGFGPARSAKVIEAAQALSGNTAPTQAAKAISIPKKPMEAKVSKTDDKKKEAKAKAKAKAKKQAAKAKVKAKKKAKAKKTSKKDKKGKKK